MLTKYIAKFSETKSYGEWFTDSENNGAPEHPIQLPFVVFDDIVDLFVSEFYQFAESHPEYQLTNYSLILRNNAIGWNGESMRNVNTDALDEQCILALIMAAIRAERFCDGALFGFFSDGYILKWLKRLKEIDDSVA
ncbi:MAG: hypothetical protein GX094_04570 [Clostridiales bacterium]|nr:hypothetical protein [Clostridiales bacterium]